METFEQIEAWINERLPDGVRVRFGVTEWARAVHPLEITIVRIIDVNTEAMGDMVREEREVLAAALLSRVRALYETDAELMDDDDDGG